MQSHTHVFPLVHYDRDGEDTELKVVHVPFVTLFKDKKDDGVHKTEILDVPFFSLVKTEHNDEGEFDNRFIKLPIVGSLFRHKREGNREKVRFLIFSYTRKVDPEVYGEERDPEERRERNSRGKGGLPRR